MALPLKENLLRYRDWLYRGNVKFPLDRLRIYCFIVCTLAVIVGGMLHFVGMMGIKRPILLTISLTWSLSDAILLGLFLTHRMGIRKAYVISALSSQVIETVRILYLAMTETIISQQFYLNEFICFAILLVAILGFFYKVSIILCVSNMINLIICRHFIPHLVNSFTISFFILLEIALLAYCFASVSFVKELTMENDEVKGKYNNFLSFMRMNDAEATSLIQLVRSAFDDEKHIDVLVAQLGDETKHNLLNLAERINNGKVADEEKIKEKFPQLSPTELTVCHLVLAGHSQKDIARILDKTESNISTVRGNIRRKLGLETSQDLREYLAKALSDGRSLGGVLLRR